MNSASKTGPDFLIIGAARSGTTSLFYYLKKHPDIFLPHTKELNHFSLQPNDSKNPVRPGNGPGDHHATEWTHGTNEYLSHFRSASREMMAGEASVSYLYGPHTAENIRAADPGIRLIAILRNPVERAWSQYQHMVRDGRENLGFKEALSQEQARISAGWEFAWHYRSLGLYGTQLRRFYKRFPASQIRIYRFEDLCSQPRKLVEDVLAFLGLPKGIELAEPVRHNQSGQVRSQLLARLINHPSRIRTAVRKLLPGGLAHSVMERMRRANLMPEHLQIPEDIRRELHEFYAEDIELTQELTGLELEQWQAGFRRS